MDGPKKPLVKDDKIDGWIYICPTCKSYICGHDRCKCGQVIDWAPPATLYKGKYKY